MEAIIKTHNYETFSKKFVENWKSEKGYKFTMGKVGFWYYTIELSGKNLLLYYKENSNKLGTMVLLAKYDIRNLIKQEDFEGILCDIHLDCIYDMIFEDFKEE